MGAVGSPRMRVTGGARRRVEGEGEEEEARSKQQQQKQGLQQQAKRAQAGKSSCRCGRQGPARGVQARRLGRPRTRSTRSTRNRARARAHHATARASDPPMELCVCVLIIAKWWGGRRGRARARLALSRTCAARALRTHLRPAWARVCRGGLPTPRGGLQTLRVPQPQQQQQLVRLRCSVFCSTLSALCSVLCSARPNP